MTDKELEQLARDMLNLVYKRLDGCDTPEAMANIQCLIGCLFDVMKENIGPNKALMALGQVMQHAAKREGPETGVRVELIAVPKHQANH